MVSGWDRAYGLSRLDSAIRFAQAPDPLIESSTRPTKFETRFDTSVKDHHVWSYAADAESIKEGEAIRFVTEKQLPLAIFNVDGEYLCTSDTCTHEASSLSDGYVEGDTAECAFHFARFSLRTGAVLCPPAIMPLKTFPVKVEDGKIYVDI
jgi:nitrite reductase/ring-hydroxylating ferredoxin subunit